MSKCLSTIVVSVLSGFSLAQAQDVTGDWLGTLARPSGESRVAMHITRSDGALKGTLDFIEQGVTGVAMDSIQLSGSRLTFQMSAVQASFEGKLDSGGSTIEGAATGQAGTAPLNFRRGVAAAKAARRPAAPSDIDGDWAGTLEGQAYVFHITNTADGLIATLDVAAQHVKGAEATTVSRDSRKISMEWKVFGSRFDGRMAPDLKSIEGAVTAAGNSFPVKLTRADAPLR